jgi:hypothetical protein
MPASPLLIQGKSRMRKRACTDLCGGRSAMVVPTATKQNQSLSVNVLQWYHPTVCLRQQISAKGGPPAQSSILIHEIAHNLTVAYGSLQPFPLYAFLPDAGLPKVEKDNNRLVDHFCKPLIEGLQ